MEVSSLTCTPRRPPGNKKEAHDVVRPVADFPPTPWGDFFIHFVPSTDEKHRAWMQQRVDELKEEVKRMLASTARGHLNEEMELVDTLQRLGLAYHFEEQINDALVRIHEAKMDSEDLHLVSLRFRLLRQHGYNISSADFNKFKDADGHFQSSLGSDAKGLLSLYEAAYLSTRADELVLEEAITFCKGKLEAMLDHLQPPFAAEVARELETPLIRRIKRLEARQYLSFYEATEGRNDLILELAKLDFNLLQSLHQEELISLSVWWKGLDLIKKLNYFARNRLVENYFWALGVYYEPHMERARMIMTKTFTLLSVMDDMYDSYGTLEELNLFTSIVQRWDISAVDELPEYMKIYFVALNDTLEEFKDEQLEEQNSYRVEYLKEEMKRVALACHEEAKWGDKRYLPTLEEDLSVTMISCTYQACTCACFLGMGDVATKGVFDWLKSFPNIMKASSMICRLMDDIMSHEFEQQRQHVVSSVQCCMKEYGVSREMACQKLYEMIEDSWKVMNQECLRPTIVPLQLLMVPFNLACMIEITYKYIDGYTHSSGATKDLISLLLVNSI